MSALPDPLAEPPHECEGGWRIPSERMVNARWPDPPPLALNASVAEAKEYLRQMEEVLIRRDADLNSIYPCSVCRPEAWERWRGGHYARDHWCPECAGTRPRRRSAREAGGGHETVPRERRDLA